MWPGLATRPLACIHRQLSFLEELPFLNPVAHFVALGVIPNVQDRDVGAPGKLLLLLLLLLLVALGRGGGVCKSTYLVSTLGTGRGPEDEESSGRKSPAPLPPTAGPPHRP